MDAVFLEVLEWFDETGAELVHRIPTEGSAEIKFGSQLVVRESQRAVASLKCPSCHGRIPADSEFCPSCGLRLAGTRKCPECGTEESIGARFCSSCGASLGE
jgi:membrane protease subunit (stomatin/prohibitin family)